MTFIKCFTKDSAHGECDSFRKMRRKLLYNPGFRVVVYYRIAVFLKKKYYSRWLPRFISRLILVRLSRVPGVEFNNYEEIGPGLSLYHPHDIVIGAGAKVGRDVKIYNGVTLGAKNLKIYDTCWDVKDRYPVVEDGVTIFSGAKIIGKITIGKNSIVGANTVVNKSFPAGSLLVGAPARNLRDIN